MLGDHQADFAFLFLALVGRIDDLDAVLDVEVMRLLVVDVGQVGERVFGEGRWRLHGQGARQAHEAGLARGLQRGDGVAAQLVQGRGRHEPGLAQLQADVMHGEDGGAEAAQLLAQRGFGAGRVGGGLVFLHDGGGGGEAVLVGQRERKAVGRFLELGPPADAAVAGLLVQRAHPGHVAVAVDLQALAQVLEAGDGVLGEQAPQRFFGIDRLGAVDLQAHQFLLQVVVAQAVAVVQFGVAARCLDLHEVLAHLGDPADGAARCLGRVEGADVFLAAVDEVVGELAVEVLVGVGREAEAGAARG